MDFCGLLELQGPFGDGREVEGGGSGWWWWARGGGGGGEEGGRRVEVVDGEDGADSVDGEA